LENVVEGVDSPITLVDTLSPLLISQTVRDLKVKNSSVTEATFGKLINIFLPKLVECYIINVSVIFREVDFYDSDFGGRYDFVGMLEERGPFPLRTLQLIDVEGKCAMFFPFCTGLFTFFFKGKEHLYRNYFNKFIVRQQQLKHLRLDYTLDIKHSSVGYFPNAIGPLWDKVRFDLTKLELIGTRLTHTESATRFFRNQRTLEKLRLCFHNVVPNTVMGAICDLQNLNKISIDCSRAHEVNNIRVEANMLQFIRNNRENLSTVSIGQSSWPGRENGKLSTYFYRRLASFISAAQIKLYSKEEEEKLLQIVEHKSSTVEENQQDIGGEPPVKKQKLGVN
jgi:hypothetical protein